jgi:hypothetical protein
MAKEKSKSGYVVVSGFNDINDFGKVWREGDDVSHFDDARLDSLVERKLVQAPKEDAKAKAAAEKEAADKAKADAKALKEQEEADVKAKAAQEKAEEDSRIAAEKEAADKAKANTPK